VSAASWNGVTVHTTSPARAESQPSSPELPAPTAPSGDDRAFDLVAFGVIVAVLALVLAAVAIIFVGDDDEPATTAGATGAAGGRPPWS
jgi:hypothetical protein